MLQIINNLDHQPMLSSIFSIALLDPRRSISQSSLVLRLSNIQDIARHGLPNMRN